MTADEYPIGIVPTKAGSAISLKVSPGASRAKLIGPHGDSLKLAVREPPERRRANRGVLRLLADALGVRPSDLEIISGAGSSRKRVLIRSLTAKAVLERIQHTLERTP